MLKKILGFTIVVTTIIVGVWSLKDTHVTAKKVNININKVEVGTLKNDKSYVLSISPHGDKKIVRTSNNKLVFHVKSGKNETAKVFYLDYTLLSNDPYSMYNELNYNIQWSQNERYVFVRDSIYDIQTDKLIKIKSNVAFKWIGNKGLYMNNGYYYTMEFDDGYSNYMAISKKINVFDAGNIKTLAYTTGDKYFVWDNIYLENLFAIKDHSLVLFTATLKYKAEKLQDIINKEYSKMIKAIYKKKKIERFEYPEKVIANGRYYLKTIRTIKIPVD